MADSITGLSTSFKALRVNSDKSKYGSFAEIGAGQEVARHFFQAGHASGTIAKSMSAYDMIFSDEIYGKEDSGRYVCESRLLKMLNTEFDLLNTRLAETKGKDTQFFSFANTVATNRGHGWVGFQFQDGPHSEKNTIVLHVKMLDKTRLQQAEVLGILGVNLIYGAFHLHEKPKNLIESLTDNISHGRIEIDLIKFSGPCFEAVDNRLMCLELVEQGLTQNVVFNAKGETSTASEEFFNQSLFLLRGEFRPITKVNLEILNLGLKEFQTDFKLQASPTPLLEITMAHLKKEKGVINTKDFLNRVDCLSHLGYPVMISNYNFYYEVKKTLRSITSLPIGMVIGGDHLQYFFEDQNYSHLDGGIFEASSKLFDQQTCVYIYPYKTSQNCASLNTFFADENTMKFLSFLTGRGSLKELSNCDEVESSVLSSYARKLLKEDNPEWKALVPDKIAKFIESKKLFK